jgi:hypothetical protein
LNVRFGLTAIHNDVFVTTYDIDGALQWVRHAPGVLLDQGHGIAVGRAGNAHVTGGFDVSISLLAISRSRLAAVKSVSLISPNPTVTIPENSPAT